MSKSVSARRDCIDRDCHLSIVRQCELLEIHRSGLYYQPVGESVLNLNLMRLIDQEHLLHPWLGVPRMTAWLRKDKGLRVNKKRIERLYGLMGISAIGPKPNTSKKGKGVLHRIYKYLLKGLKVVRPNQVWAMDITYIPVQGGHLYLCAIIDLYSRYVVGWSLSNTMTSNWCRETLQEAIEKHGKPEILNTDQGSQFTCLAYVDLLKGEGIKISMDGKGRALDNIYIERFWRTIKYQHIYLNPASDGIRLYIGIKKWLQRYHNKNHQGINQKPIEKYRNAA